MSGHRNSLAVTLVVWFWCLQPAVAQVRALPPSMALPDDRPAASSAVAIEDSLLGWGVRVEMGVRICPPMPVATPVYQPSRTWQVLPEGLIYKSYLVGDKEPRLASVWFYDEGQGWIWDAALGGRVGVLRYGTEDPVWPEGWQLDVEGAAFPRLALERDRDMVSTDFVVAIPLTYRRGKWEAEFSYSHLSSHLGDEFQVTFPKAERINYVWDGLFLGVGFRPFPSLRVYSEVGWGFYTRGGADPWRLQFGVEYSPVRPSGLLGAPFLAIGGQIREELHFGGHLAVQAGWQWRGRSGRLFRTGLHYFNGKSNQSQFFARFEHQIGLGAWWDY